MQINYFPKDHCNSQDNLGLCCCNKQPQNFSGIICKSLFLAHCKPILSQQQWGLCSYHSGSLASLAGSLLIAMTGEGREWRIAQGLSLPQPGGDTYHFYLYFMGQNRLHRLGRAGSQLPSKVRGWDASEHSWPPPLPETRGQRPFGQ